ncbi:COG1470 family protein [Streptomyces sp. HUAS TT7]|uniref:COG1470 family protein n=1 Tax=Streptomyces sp. HUAS TT7 TaxID=3447507 RepID=UPI003F655A3F
MTVRAELTVPDEVITPGDSLTAHLRVWNESRIVDAYRLTLIGPPADWPNTEAALGQLPVYPGNHEKINIPLTLPRHSDLPPGPLTFAVQVASVEDPLAVAVPEATLSVGEFHDLDMKPVRPRVGGALWSTNLILLENTGNATTTFRLHLAPEAPDAPLRTKLRRTRLALDAGEEARVGLSVRVTSPVPVGTAADWKLGVRGGWGDEEERTAEFVHRQRPILPKRAMKALIALTAVAVAAVALWLSPVGGKKPTVKTESNKGPSQVEAVQQAEKKAADEKKKQADDQKKQEEQAKKEKDEAGAPKKKPLDAVSLSTDSKAKKLTDEYTVPKGYRLVLKAVQITATGPATGSLVLRAGTQQLVTTPVTAPQSPSAMPPSLKAGEKISLLLNCPAPAGGGAPSPSVPPGPQPTDCMATAALTGDLIPLTGPNAEKETPPTGAPAPNPSSRS